VANQEKTVYLVHCVDTEGPLYESLEATGERLKAVFGLDVHVTPETLARLKQGELVPAEMKDSVVNFLSRLDYMQSWDQLDIMLDEIFSPTWRKKYSDDFGRGYVFSWFILDHVGFITNPRRRALGYHAVYDHYRQRLSQGSSPHDRLYWHYHPTSYFREANKTSNNFSYTCEHLNVLSRRIIDHLDFPAAFRPGSHVERPDINLFLELWIPIDFGNQGMPERPEDQTQNDNSAGRYGDWRRAPTEWGIYHPDFYDYQRPGQMRRYMARCLNLDARVRPITREEIIRAFEAADGNGKTILSVTNHDEREMRTGIDWFMKTTRAVQAEMFPEIKIQHANAVEAVRALEGMPRNAPANLSFEWDGPLLKVHADQNIWGPQPYFCFKTRTGQYIHENLDHQGPHDWSFVFDDYFVTLDQIEAIGVATNDRCGNASVYRLTPDRDLAKTVHRHRNDADWL
tara:strand:+ start:3249 stop:4616 length:1368 start_codon:yes stop_codon:yes gene_type:complete